ncbi:MAG: 16S rRNA (guanine(527)-N(7))-methyltransferase RsmG [Pseudomonadota bacterium]
MADLSTDLPPQELITVFAAQLSIPLNGEQAGHLVDFCALILRWNRLTSLVRASNITELVRAHVIDCLAAVDEVYGKEIVDVGSGAGFPGIVFALTYPDRNFTLVESNQRRARFLTQVKIELGLANVTIANCRVEALQPSEEVSCVTSRAYSSLRQFYQDCQHLIYRPADTRKTVQGTATGATRFVAFKGRIEEHEIGELSLPPSAVRIKPLTVPDRDYRHLVIIDSGAC